MIEAMSMLRGLILQHLDPAHFKLEATQLNDWIDRLKWIKEQVFRSMNSEMLSNVDCRLVERHLKQAQYDCRYLTKVLYRYQDVPPMAAELYAAAGVCLEELLEHIEGRYSGFFNWSKDPENAQKKAEEPHRIRVLFSVDALAYLFKLLNKAGGLDAGPTTQLMTAIARNFITPGVGIGYISPKSVTNKYKQVVQATALSVRKLLVKMLRHLDEEFAM